VSSGPLSCVSVVAVLAPSAITDSPGAIAITQLGERAINACLKFALTGRSRDNGPLARSLPELLLEDEIAMSRGIVFFAILVTLSFAAHAKRATFQSPWHLYVVCDNDKVVDDATISKQEFLVPDTGTRWRCKVTALEPSTDGSSASRDLVCSTDTGLTVSDGIDTLRGAQHDAHLHVRDNRRLCSLGLAFGDWEKAMRSVCDR
jgi:hypothetical protein